MQPVAQPNDVLNELERAATARYGTQGAEVLTPALRRLAEAIAAVRVYPLAPEVEPALEPMHVAPGGRSGSVQA